MNKGLGKIFIIILGLLLFTFIILYGLYQYELYKIHKSEKLISEIIKPFDHKALFKMTPEKYIWAQYRPDNLVKCYLSDETQKNTKAYKELKKLHDNNVIYWNLLNVTKQGYYETDTCFVAYLNPDVEFTVDNYKEAAEFSEMVITRVFDGKIRFRKDYSPAENTELVSLVAHPEHGFTGNKVTTIFGFYKRSYDNVGKVFINTDFYANKDKNNKSQLSWRLNHEYLHSFSSPYLDDILYNTNVRYSALDETLTEYLNNHIAQIMDPKHKDHSDIQAVKELLKYITIDELVDAYFNGSTYSLKRLVDNRTYDGAFCSLFHYSVKVNDYGHGTSEYIEKVLQNPSLRVEDKWCAY